MRVLTIALLLPFFLSFRKGTRRTDLTSKTHKCTKGKKYVFISFQTVTKKTEDLTEVPNSSPDKSNITGKKSRLHADTTGM